MKQYPYKLVNTQNNFFSSLIVRSSRRKNGRVIGATSHVHNTLNGDRKCFFIMNVVCNAIQPLHGHPRHQSCRKIGNVWPATYFETVAHHMWHPFPAATVVFLAHTLCGCPSHPQVASTRILAESEAPGLYLGGRRNIIQETLTTNEVCTSKWMRAAQKGLKNSYIHPFGHGI